MGITTRAYGADPFPSVNGDEFAAKANAQDRAKVERLLNELDVLCDRIKRTWAARMTRDEKLEALGYLESAADVIEREVAE